MNKDMIYVKPVSFRMGSDISEDELPIREVTLKPYYIDKYPVTNEEFSRFVLAKCYKNKDCWCDDGWNFIQKNKITEPCYWNDSKWNKKEYPVTGISWYEAKAYAFFVGKSLPTEAQWEYGAKGNTNRLYPWGDEKPTSSIATFAHGCMASLDRTPTTSNNFNKNRSAVGCYDMAGNFFEWCLDSVSENYAWDNNSNNPVYIDKNNNIKIARGGSGMHDEDCLRCSARDSYVSTVGDNIFTIRCVLNIGKGSLKTPRISKKPSSLLYYQEEPPKKFNIQNWRLNFIHNSKITKLNYDQVMKLPQTTISRRMVCVCNWSIRRNWSGTYLIDLLNYLNICPQKNMYLRQISIGNKNKKSYDSTVKLDNALSNNSMIIHSVDGKPLTLEQGYPLRFYNFALLGYKSVKGLQAIEITNKYEKGYWEEKAGYDIEGIIRKKRYYFVDLNEKKYVKNEGEVKNY